MKTDKKIAMSLYCRKTNMQTDRATWSAISIAICVLISVGVVCAQDSAEHALRIFPESAEPLSEDDPAGDNDRVRVNFFMQGTKQSCRELAARLALDANTTELTSLIGQAKENFMNTKEQFRNSVFADGMCAAERKLATSSAS